MTAKKAHTDTMILDVVPLGFCTGTELLNTRPHSNQIALPMVKDGPPGSGGTKRQGQKVKTDSPVPFKPTSTWADKFQLRLDTGPVKPQLFHRWFFSVESSCLTSFFFFFFHVSLLLGPSGRQKRKARGLGCMVDLTPTNDHNSTRTTEKPAFCLDGWKTIKISSKLSNKGNHPTVVTFASSLLWFLKFIFVPTKKAIKLQRR